jgi:hypothetical protein
LCLGGGGGALNATPTALAGADAGAGAGQGFGLSVASAGDVNGDGFADLIIGASDSTTGAVKAFVYLGGAEGLDAMQPVVLAVTTGPTEGYGTSVSSAGDVNGDGYADVLVGALDDAGGAGAVYLYLGGVDGPMNTPTRLIGPAPQGSFGCSVASAGDVNGDGFADIVVGAFGTGSKTGLAYVYFGGGGGVNASPLILSGQGGDGGGGSFGTSVSGAGDVNGDGFADVVVGASGAVGGAGAAYVYLGGAGGLEATPSSTLPGPGGSNEYFGVSVASAGDVNGDGFADVIGGAAGINDDPGAAYVYLGGADGLGPAPIALGSLDSGQGFGDVVAGAGDVDGDGVADVVVDADLNGTGFAYLYLGGVAGLSTTPATALASPSGARSGFGASLASARGVYRTTKTPQAPASSSGRQAYPSQGKHALVGG